MITVDRRACALVAGVGGLVAVVGAALLVPWSPVPGGLPPLPAAEDVFPAAQLARAEDFSRWARAWSWGSLAVSLLVACGIGFSRWGTRLVRALPGPWWVQVVLCVAALALLGRLLTLPFGLLLHRLRVEHGLSTQGVGEYLLDVAKGELVGLVLTSLVVLVLVGSARRWRRAWPVVSGTVLAGLVLVGSFVFPVLVEPLFNRFTPLADGALRGQVLELAERQDVRVDEVLVADASRRTTTLNAYVSGLGSTRRIVVYDNLVEDLPRDQALAVVAHELAHARHRDVVTGSALGAAGALCGTGLLGLAVGATGRRRDVRMADPGVVPLVLALVAVGALLSSPLQAAVSRQIELRADVEALAATRDPEAFVEMQKQLAARSLSDPTPPAWSQLWFGSHPTVLQRVALAGN